MTELKALRVVARAARAYDAADDDFTEAVLARDTKRASRLRLPLAHAKLQLVRALGVLDKVGRT